MEESPGRARCAEFAEELRAMVRSGQFNMTYHSMVSEGNLESSTFTSWWQDIAHAVVVKLGLNKRAQYLQSACALRSALNFCMRASPSTPPGRLVATSARVVRGPNFTTDRTFPIGGVAVA